MQRLDLDYVKEQKKTDFMERMYQCSGRTNGLYTGLWQEFCLNEAGPIMRDRYFEMLEAITIYEERKLSKEIEEACLLS
tara:strand:+ start:1418 stop:1654 length:237 start_codon:yes stop_codon:yes gene_type:complete